MRLLVVLAMTLSLACAATSRADTITLDFNDFAMTWTPSDLNFDLYQRHSMDYVVDGVHLEGGVNIVDSGFAHYWGDAQGGTGYALNGSGVMHATDFSLGFGGALFSLSSLEMMTGVIGAPFSASGVRLDGYRAGVLTASRTIELSDLIIDPAARALWQSVAGDLGEVDRIDFTGLNPYTPNDSSRDYWVDDLVVHRVPEPSLLLLVGLGTCALAIYRRRHRDHGGPDRA